MAYTERFVTDAASGGDGNDNLGLALSSATYDHTGGTVERMVTLAGAFSGYTWVAGDLIYITGAPAGGVADNTLYEIASRVGDNDIGLVAHAGLTADSTADLDSSAGPWTLAEAMAAAVAGDRVNVQSDSGYSTAADVYDNEGTSASVICWRGYNLLIGDLENSGWNADGSLNVTNYPVITCTGTQSHGANANKYNLFQNLVYVGSVNSRLFGSTAVDKVFVVECKFTNTANHASARATQFDNGCTFTNCDFACTGASHNFVTQLDNSALYYDCRFTGTETSEILCSIDTGSVYNCVFIGPGIGISHLSAISQGSGICGNTFYNLTTAIEAPDVIPSTLMLLANNHCTDCTNYIVSLHSASADMAVMEVNNRTRDNGTARTGIGNGCVIGEVTTDTGDKDTDYTDADNDDMTLIDGAPGVETGLRQHRDIGGLQRAAGSGGGLLVNPGTSGGMQG